MRGEKFATYPNASSIIASNTNAFPGTWWSGACSTFVREIVGGVTKVAVIRWVCAWETFAVRTAVEMGWV